MKKGKRKNQIVITALALMIAVAGYLNFSGKEFSLSEAKNTKKQEKTDEVALDLTDEDMLSYSDLTSDTKETMVSADAAGSEVSKDAAEETLNPDVSDGGDDSLISAAVTDDVKGAEEVAETKSDAVVNAVMKAQLSKEQSRAQNKEMLNDLINNENATKKQKKEAANRLMQLSDFMEKEAAAEQVLSAKGYENAMVSMSEDAVDVMVSLDEITDVDRTKIEDVVQRKTGVSINNIVISSFK